jgi:hypothetical protein
MGAPASKTIGGGGVTVGMGFEAPPVPVGTGGMSSIVPFPPVCELGFGDAEVCDGIGLDEVDDVVGAGV